MYRKGLLYAVFALASASVYATGLPSDQTADQIGTADESVTETAASIDVSKIQTLTQEEKIALYNASHDESDKIVCERYRPVGTHRKYTRCVTIEQKRLERAAALEFMRLHTGGAL